MHKIKANLLPYILPFVLIPAGIIGIYQNREQPFQVCGLINLILGTAVFGSMGYFPKLRRGRNLNSIMWICMLSVFQLWPLIPIAILVPEEWQLRLSKACGLIIRSAVALVLLYCLLRFVMFFMNGTLFTEPIFSALFF